MDFGRPRDHLCGWGHDHGLPDHHHDDVAFILADSEAKIVLAEDEVQVAKVLNHLGELPAVRTVVQMVGRVEHELVISWADLEQRGADYLAVNPAAVEDVIAGIRPQDLATLIYTSGTTGRPKGVRLVDDNWTYVGASIEAYDLLAPDDLQYLWLPLSHAFGKVMIAAQLRIGFATGRWPDRQDRGKPCRRSIPRSWPARRGSSRRSGPG